MPPFIDEGDVLSDGDVLEGSGLDDLTLVMSRGRMRALRTWDRLLWQARSHGRLLGERRKLSVPQGDGRAGLTAMTEEP